MFCPYVTLRSGGYLVINQTEALVAIDVNSGKSTREFSIEETALNTNLEAADEIARQLKLRDLAGLIVIDFIDMEERRNNRKVESRIKDALRHDRARIQVGRISHFGLLEMSRQRLRTGVLEGSTSQCPHCQGTGIIRSTESMALAVLRGIEDELMKGRPSSLTALTTAGVALYILNHKRAFVTDIERRYGITINVHASERMQGANFAIERPPAMPSRRSGPSAAAVNMEWGFEGEDREIEPPREPRSDNRERGCRCESGGRRDDAAPASPAARRGDRGGMATRGRPALREQSDVAIPNSPAMSAPPMAMRLTTMRRRRRQRLRGDRRDDVVRSRGSRAPSSGDTTATGPKTGASAAARPPRRTQPRAARGRRAGDASSPTSSPAERWQQ